MASECGVKVWRRVVVEAVYGAANTGSVLSINKYIKSFIFSLMLGHWSSEIPVTELIPTVSE
jgi:hypothetical protein